MQFIMYVSTVGRATVSLCIYFIVSIDFILEVNVFDCVSCVVDFPVCSGKREERKSACLYVSLYESVSGSRAEWLCGSKQSDLKCFYL